VLRNQRRSCGPCLFLLVVLLLFVVGGFATEQGRGATAPSLTTLSRVPPPDTLCGGSGNPQNGDPNDYDFWAPFAVWVGRFIVLGGR
jgi:hypothetical protein